MDDIGNPARFRQGRLIAFAPLVPGGVLGASARFERERNLVLSYDLQIPDSRLVWPAPVSGAHREDDLWKSTCMELFLAAHGDPSYIEINLSPSGNWNIYQFSDERKGMQQVKSARVEIHTSEKGFERRLVAQVDCPEVVQRLKVKHMIGVSAVVNLQAGQMEYWALQHSGKKPDFHRRVDWLWQLEG